MSSSKLPEPTNLESFVTVDPFATGRMEALNGVVIKGLSGQSLRTSWRFFITHKPSQTKLWFDLGIGPDLTVYPPRIRRVQHKVFTASPALNNPRDDMAAMEEDPVDVKYIIASHAHWDHMFPAKQYLPKAKVICGPGTFEVASSCWPENEDSAFDGHIWDPKRALLPIEELPSPTSSPHLWKQLGPFEEAYDFFNDGSFWIINSPGHMLGHITALCRVQSLDGSILWIYLGGDCAHCDHLITYPDAPFGVLAGGVTQTATLHDDEADARSFVKKVWKLKDQDSRVRIWLGHADSLEGEWEVPSKQATH